MRNATNKIVRTNVSSSAMTFTFKRYMASGLLTKYEASIEQLPMREAVKYNSIKNGKWTATELKVHLQQFKYNFIRLVVSQAVRTSPRGQPASSLSKREMI